MSPLKAKCQIKCIHTITVVWLAWNLCQPLFRDIQKTSNSGDLIFKDAWTRTDWRLNPSMPQLDSSQSCPDISSIPCEHSMWRMGKSRNVGAESQGRVKYSENINVGTRKGYDLVKSVTPLQSERIRKEPKGSERIQFGKADGWLSNLRYIPSASRSLVCCRRLVTCRQSVTILKVCAVFYWQHAQRKR